MFTCAEEIYLDYNNLKGGAEITALQIYDAKRNKVVLVEKIEKSDAEWRKLLTG